MKKEDLIKLKYSEDEVDIKRENIRKELIIKSHNIDDGEIKKIDIEDLKNIFYLYSKYFFNDYFTRVFEGKITFSLSNRMNKSAGKTMVFKNNFLLEEKNQSYEIRIGVNFFFQYYELDREKVVVGVKTKDALDALLRVFEHEIIHLIEFYILGRSSCKNKRFKLIAENIFKHKDVYHSLPTKGEIVATNLDVKIGDKVTFLYKQKRKVGIVVRINKRASVMVLDKTGSYMDKQGSRYSKYYVPLNGLTSI